MDQNNRKKRPLPSWMLAVSGQGKASKLNTRESEKNLNSKSDTYQDCIAVSSKNSKSNILNVKESSVLNAGDVIAQSMPFVKFPGSIIYSYHKSDCIGLCEDISSLLKEDEKTPVGFDVEWPVTFKPGQTNTISLIQICLKNTCYLFHVSAMNSVPKSLLNLILDKRILLVGLNIDGDLWKLAKDFDINVKCIFDDKRNIDVGKLANVKLKCVEKWSLEGLCRNILRKRLEKCDAIRCSNWSQFPLEREQKLYAANDAYASLLLYLQLL